MTAVFAVLIALVVYAGTATMAYFHDVPRKPIAQTQQVNHGNHDRRS